MIQKIRTTGSVIRERCTRPVWGIDEEAQQTKKRRVRIFENGKNRISKHVFRPRPEQRWSPERAKDFNDPGRDQGPRTPGQSAKEVYAHGTAGIGRSENGHSIPMTRRQVLKHAREEVAMRVDERGAKTRVDRALKQILKERRLAGARFADNVY